MYFYGGMYEKWLRITSSIGCLYLDCCMHGAIVPLLTEMQWSQSGNATISGLSKGTAPLSVAATFFSAGMVEILFSPIAGLVADRWGLDIVILFGLLCATLKCLLYGLTTLTPLILLANRSLQGVVSAFTQTMAMARITDFYGSTSSFECTIVTGVAMCKLSFNLFASLFVGELFRYLNSRVFLLFLPVEFGLIVCVLLTFRTENFHKKEETRSDDGTITLVDKKKRRSVRWGALFDVQVLIISLSFLVMNLGQAALDPSLAIWVEYVFGEGTVASAHLLGLCGFSVILSAVCCTFVLETFSKDFTWIFCTVSLFIAGLPLVLVKFSPSLTVASLCLAVYFFGLQAARVILITMCSTVAVTRYPEAYSLVFSLVNLGWSGAFLVGPLLAPPLFGSSCTICMIGVACILTALLAFFLRNIDSKDGLSFMDCFCVKASSDDGYQLVATNENSQITFDLQRVMIQTIEH